MKLFEISPFPEKVDQTFSQALAAFVEKHGSEAFYGGQATVVDRGSHVWRTWFKDPGYDKFLEYVKTHKSVHFPKIYGDVRTTNADFKGVKRGPLKYIRIEKLKELDSSSLSDAIDMIGLISRAKWPDTVEELAELISTMKLPVGVDHDDDKAELLKAKAEILKNKEFFKVVLELLKAGANDINSQNVMMRGSTLVITDPFS